MRTLLSAPLAALMLVASCGGDPAEPTPSGAVSVFVLGSSVSMTAGQTKTVSVTLTRTGEFEGGVDLAVEGAPAGMTTSWSPSFVAAGATTATLTITTTSSFTPGTTSLTIRASGDDIDDATATISVTVTAPVAQPGFSMTVTPTTGLTIPRGGSAQITVSVVRETGFTGSVLLSPKNGPTGVSFTASIGSTETSKVVTVSASSSATLGTSTITIRGADFGGNVSKEVTIPITIAGASSIDFSLSAPGLSLPLATTGTVTITVTRQNGYTGDVSVSVSNAPTWVTPKVETSVLTNGATSTTIAFEVYARATVGSSSLTVTAGGSGISPVSKTFALTVSGLQPGKWKAASLSSSGGTTCALTTAGAAYCWGINYNGGIGNGTSGSLSHAFVPTAVSGGHVFKQITVGSAVCGLTNAGAAYCWGDNDYGQAGATPSTAAVTTPVAVGGGLTFTSLTAGGGTTCGLTTQGAAYCWGSGGTGELGNGTFTEKTSVPVPVSGGRVFTSLTAGRSNICGLVASGEAYCWGYGQFGVLTRPGNSSSSNVPIAVAAGLTFSSLVASSDYTVCGITTTGSTYCWGENSYGELGNGSKATFVATPAAVTGGHTFASIGRSNGRARCALKADGTAWCWGSNSIGNFGDQTQTSTTSPVAAGFGLKFKVITGGLTTCGIALDDYVYCMGDGTINSEAGPGGQLGNGKTVYSNNAFVPVAVFAPGTPVAGGASAGSH